MPPEEGIETMTLKSLPSSFQTFRTAIASHYADIDPARGATTQEPDWGETAMAISATAMAVVVVAFIAVLMGLG